MKITLKNIDNKTQQTLITIVQNQLSLIPNMPHRFVDQGIMNIISPLLAKVMPGISGSEIKGILKDIKKIIKTLKTKLEYIQYKKGINEKEIEAFVKLPIKSLVNDNNLKNSDYIVKFPSGSFVILTKKQFNEGMY